MKQQITLLNSGKSFGKNKKQLFTPAVYGALGMFFMSVSACLMGVICYINI